MATNTKEIGFEQHIAQHLAMVNGYIEGHNSNYNKTECIDEKLFFEFLATSQPKTLEKLQIVHGNNYKKKIFQRLQNLINREGIIEVLRKGVIDNNIKIDLFYNKPSSVLNPDAIEKYNQNIFSVTRQVHYSNKNNNSLDLVLFLNGLPIITMELKNELTNQTYQDAIKQYKTNRDPKEELFKFGRCIVHFAVDTDQVWMTTHLKSDATYFLPFNKGNNNGAGNPPNPDGIKTDYLWKEILTKDTLSMIIQNFVKQFEEEKEGYDKEGQIKIEKSKKLIFPRYHQLDVVNKLLNDVREKGVGRRYLIQHSAGSGKSNSISWLSHQLVSTFQEDGKTPIFDSIIVVTDRRVLDAQIRSNIQQFAQVRGVVEAITEGSKQLREALEQGKKIIITTIQKFPFILTEIGELKGSKFAIIIDEAHSTQSGKTATQMNMVLANNTENINGKDEDEEWTDEDEIIRLIEAKKLLKNASYFAFTATPKQKTLELFGEKIIEDDVEKFRAFHLYSMKQAIEENFILDILQNYTTSKSYFELIKRIDDDPEFDKKKALSKLRTFVESHELAIEKKTEIMIEHFIENVIKKKKINGLAKSIIVTSSRANAISYKRAFDNYLSVIRSPYKAIVAFSGEVNGETEEKMNGFYSQNIPNEFKKAEYRFLIVANKFQTGFDQPLLHTMYVDKQLGGVQAVQTLSRLNRTTSGKFDTFILDFVNDIEDIKEAFDPYYITTTLKEATDPNKLFDLQSKLNSYEVYSSEDIDKYAKLFISNADIQLLHRIIDFSAHIFTFKLSKEDKESFHSYLVTYLRLYSFLSQIIPFNNINLEKLYIFLNMLLPKLQLPIDDSEKIGILLSYVDLDSYRIQKIGETKVILEQGEELDPLPAEIKSTSNDPVFEKLSEILSSFNSKFGTDFKDEDKVESMSEEIFDDVMNDFEFQDSYINSDEQNAFITFEQILSEKMVNHIDANMDLYNKFTNDKAFKELFSKSLFSYATKIINNKIHRAK